jgi:hypothetical protein
MAHPEEFAFYFMLFIEYLIIFLYLHLTENIFLNFPKIESFGGFRSSKPAQRSINSVENGILD